MTSLPVLVSNSQFILDNFFQLKAEDFMIHDLEFNKFVYEFSEFGTGGEVPNEKLGLFNTDVEPVEKPLGLTYFGANFFKKIKLGSGAFGSVLEYKDKTLKIFENPYAEKYQRIEFIHNYNKYIISYRVYEGIASTYINDILSKYTNCFYKTYGVYILTLDVFRDNVETDVFSKTYRDEWSQHMNPKYARDDFTEYKTCMAMEKLQPIPLHLFNSEQVYYILFIILSNVYFLQNVCQFVHGDLHLKNIMSSENTEDIKLVYGDEIITIPNIGWKPVLIDFGYCSFNYGDKRVSSNVEPYTASGSNFDSYFDISKIFGSMLNLKTRNGKVDADLTSVEEIFCYKTGFKYADYMKADNEANYQYLISNRILKSLPEILTFLASKIQYTSTKTNSIPRNIDKFYEIVHFQEEYCQITPFIEYYNVKYKTIEPHWKLAPYSTILNVHIISISNYANDYMFTTKCCKQTVFDFISAHEGVAINGTYFNMRTGDYVKHVSFDYGYKDYKGNEIKEQPKYLQYYAGVNIQEHKIKIENYKLEDIWQPSYHDSSYTDKKGIFHKSEYIEHNNPNVNPMFTNPDTQIFLAAPILVQNGIKNKLNVEAINDRYKRAEKYKFTCSDKYPARHLDVDITSPKNSLERKFKEDKYHEIRDDKNIILHNCKHIEEGELYHIGNPNPRTLLAMKGDHTYFIVIEGRTKEYTGATFEQMQDFVVNYLHADDSINLDGGASCMMMWNIGGTVYSPMKTINRKTIGNVVGFVKK